MIIAENKGKGLFPTESFAFGNRPDCYLFLFFKQNLFAKMSILICLPLPGSRVGFNILTFQLPILLGAHFIMFLKDITKMLTAVET